MSIASSNVLNQDPALLAQREIPISARLLMILIFLLGVGSLFYISVGAQLYISEILLMIAFPVLWVRKGRLVRENWVKGILLFGLLWFVSQLVTDIIRSTPFSDLIRGWAGILVFLISFLSLLLLLGNQLGRIKIYLLGCVVGGLLQPSIQPDIYFSVDPWKFGYGPPVTLLAMLLIVHLHGGQVGKLKRWVLLLIGLSGLSFYLNTRSMGAIILVTAILVWLPRTKLFAKYLKRSVRLSTLFIWVFIVSIAIVGIFKIYEYTVKQGWLGAASRSKYYSQLGGTGMINLILAGRTELISSYFAILDSPLIGHGSWPRDPSYGLKTFTLLLDRGYDAAIAQYQIDLFMTGKRDLIPTHSHLLQAWVWAGFLGAVFWIFITALILKSILINFRYPGPLFVLVVYFSLYSGWDILFSPFNAWKRLEWCIRLIVFLIAIYYPHVINKSSGNSLLMQ